MNKRDKNNERAQIECNSITRQESYHACSTTVKFLQSDTYLKTQEEKIISRTECERNCVTSIPANITNKKSVFKASAIMLLASPMFSCLSPLNNSLANSSQFARSLRVWLYGRIQVFRYPYCLCRVWTRPYGERELHAGIKYNKAYSTKGVYANISCVEMAAVWEGRMVVPGNLTV